MALLSLVAAVAATAQEGLGVDKIFRDYGHAKGCKMVEMHNAKLRGYAMRVYKSITCRTLPNPVDECLKEDRKSAKKVREVVEDGKITSGYYLMPPLEKGINRYILFSRTGKGGGAVIYIEGNLSPDDIMKLCYSRK